VACSLILTDVELAYKEKRQRRAQSGEEVDQPRFELGTSRMQKSVTLFIHVLLLPIQGLNHDPSRE
jgi:hypothetical protein